MVLAASIVARIKRIAAGFVVVLAAASIGAGGQIAMQEPHVPIQFVQHVARFFWLDSRSF